MASKLRVYVAFDVIALKGGRAGVDNGMLLDESL